MKIFNYIGSAIFFWMVWILIPLIVEITPALINFFILIKKRIVSRTKKKLDFYPEITLIVPVYNSADTLRECIESIVHSDYPNELIYVILVNNESKDNSFEIFQDCQRENPELMINWLNSEQGKSKALNLALFNSAGKYIIHIDSDGTLHPKALKNVVRKFEHESNTHCITGVILTNSKMIDETENFGLRLLRKAEYFEYCQAFLAGRNYQSEFNNIFTMSGAFSAFRKSAILQTQLYNTDTVGEDTHVTFQVREKLKLKVKLCENAFYYVDPIESFDRLYTQRQRWQRGEIEVAHIFLKKDVETLFKGVSNFAVRLLIYDHTFAFPRMIWYFALICLLFLNYPLKLIVFSSLLIYVLYSLSSFLFYLNIIGFMRDFKEERRFYIRKWYLVLIMPLYNFITFWFRFAGIINSIKEDTSWKTRTLTQERAAISDRVSKDFNWIIQLINKIKRKISIGQNNEK
ncbi:MAG: putative glycosyltransferase, exosortase G system-associated [Anaerolineaceae bacterium]|nr:MAG: putative glycosyltransferase, exosortase G system-associated [Anaerolineaceae bacterium]